MSKQTAQSPQKRILIVEDEVVIIQSLERILALLDYAVVGVAASGEQALQCAKETQPDLMLMDIHLKGTLDGIETAQHIQEHFDIPVIYLTGYADNETLERAKLTGPFAYLVKPVDSSALHRAIEIAFYKHGMEQQLRASEARYRAVSELISDFAYAFQINSLDDWRLEWITEAFTKVTGFTREDITPRMVLNRIIHPEDYAIAREHMQSVIQGHTSVSEFRIHTQAGETRWLRVHSRPEKNKAENRVRRVIGAAEDITAQKQAEAALAREQHLLHTLMNNVPDHIYFKDQKSRFIAINRAQAERFGLSNPDEALDKTDFDFFSEEHAQQAYEDEQHIIQNAQPIIGIEEKETWPDGQETWVSTTKMPLYDEQGNIVGTFGISRDITTRKQAERIQARLAAIVEDSDDAIMSKTLDGIVVTWNTGAEKIYGYSADEMVGESITKIMLPEQQDEVYAYLARIGRGERILHQETERLTKSGQRIYVSLNMSPLRDSDGHIIGASVIARDITARKHAEATIRRERDFAESLIQTAQAIILLLDPQGCILRINPYMETLSGYRLEDVKGKDWFKTFLPPRSSEQIQDLFEHAIAGNPTRGNVNAIVTQQGEERFIEWYDKTLEDARGQTLGLLAIGHDITERLQAQKALQKAHNELEMRVRARTAELADANRRLQQEIVERERADAAMRRYAQEQATLYAITSAATSLLEPGPLLNAALDALLPALNAHAAWVMRPPTKSNTPPRLAVARHVPQTFLDYQNTDAMYKCAQCLSQEHNAHTHSTLITDCPHAPARAMTAAGFTDHIGIPLRGPRSRAYGTLNLAWKHGAMPPDLDENLLIAIGQQIGLALHNAQLYQAAQQVDRLETVNAIGTAVVSSLETDVVLRQILELTCYALDAMEGSILLLDPQTDELIFAQTLSKANNALLGMRLAPGQGIAGWAVEHRQPVRVNDVHEDPRWYHDMDTDTGFQTHSLLCVPMFYHDQITGAIEMVNKQQGVFTKEDTNLLEAIATIAAIALENARLYEDLKGALAAREEAQSQLIHAEKMAALGRLAASIAHEINNPLQAVLGCMMLSQEEVGGMMRKEKLNRHLDVAVTEVKRVSEIVHRMHDFYRHARSELQQVDVPMVLDSVLTLSSKQLEHSKIKVAKDYAADLPNIQANSDHLKQVFLNLVINAIDAMPNGGTLHIQIQQANTIPATVQVTISDTGIGMTKDVQQRLFEPFFTTKDQGSGLGLSISYGIIESHNGKILVNSQIGKGTTFTIQLPILQP